MYWQQMPRKDSVWEAEGLEETRDIRIGQRSNYKSPDQSREVGRGGGCLYPSQRQIHLVSRHGEDYMFRLISTP